MNLELKDRKPFVSGSTAGVGLAIVTRLAREGAEVLLSGRSQSA